MKRGEGWGQAPAAALPLPACEPGCCACIVLHRKACVLAAAHACRRAAPSPSPDVVMRFLSDSFRPSFGVAWDSLLSSAPAPAPALYRHRLLQPSASPFVCPNAWPKRLQIHDSILLVEFTQRARSFVAACVFILALHACVRARVSWCVCVQVYI